MYKNRDYITEKQYIANALVVMQYLLPVAYISHTVVPLKVF